MKFVTVLCLLIVVKRYTAGTSRPIIGVVAQELDPFTKQKFPTHSSFIAASYVKALESSGAQVVPIAIDQPDSYYDKILTSINGVVFPGGAAKNGPGNPSYDTVKKIYRIASELNDRNVTFPILGVCLGFEFMLTISNGDEANMLRNCSVHFENLPLNFSSRYNETGFFKTLPENLYCQLKSQNFTVNWHNWCASKEDIEHDRYLQEQWRVTSTSTSSKNWTFVASLENRKYPFFGLQFHPEKVAFEWRKDRDHVHAADAILANRFFYDRLVDYARQNNQRFSDPTDESRALIYNVPVKFTQAKSRVYTQMYFDPCTLCSAKNGGPSVSRPLVVFILVTANSFWCAQFKRTSLLT